MMNYIKNDLQNLLVRFFLLALFACFYALPSYAQTSIGIQETSQEKYKQELDSAMLNAYEGDRNAQFKVAILIANNQFGDPDYEQAAYWYKQAARQGHVLAQYNLGHQHLNGQGVDKNETLAMKWWLEAANQEHSLAQFNVGRGYYLGIGLEKNTALSRQWFERAADNQEPKSIEILKQLGWDSKLPTTTPVAAISTESPTQEQSEVEVDDTVEAAQSKAESIASNSVSSTSPSSSTDSVLKSVGLYTNPNVRSILIKPTDDVNNINVLKQDGKWLIVNFKGKMPIWIHSDFIKTYPDDDKAAIVNGDRVNVRSVPIITKGSIVGRLNTGDKVTIVDSQSGWHRVVSSKQFKVWVNKSEYDELKKKALTLALNSNKETELVAAKKKLKPIVKKAVPLIKPLSKPLVKSTIAPHIRYTVKTKPFSNTKNDNAWLFFQNPGHFTLQLPSFDDGGKLQALLAHSSLVDNQDLHRFSVSNNSLQWAYFLYGSFADRTDAEKAQSELSHTKTWVRTFDQIKQSRCVSWKKQLPPPRTLNQYCKD